MFLQSLTCSFGFWLKPIRGGSASGFTKSLPAFLPGKLVSNWFWMTKYGIKDSAVLVKILVKLGEK